MEAAVSAARNVQFVEQELGRVIFSTTLVHAKADRDGAEKSEVSTSKEEGPRGL